MMERVEIHHFINTCELHTVCRVMFKRTTTKQNRKLSICAITCISQSKCDRVKMIHTIKIGIRTLRTYIQ